MGLINEVYVLKTRYDISHKPLKCWTICLWY